MEINGIEKNEAVRYEELHLSDEVMQALGKKGFEVATPIQAGCVPFLMDWKDIVAKAPPAPARPLPSASRWWSIPTRLRPPSPP